MLIVRRSKPESNFLIVPNVALFDERLGYLARGVLHDLLGRPPGWQTNAERLAATAQRHRGAKGESKRALRIAFAELEAAGYMTRTRSRVPKGEPNGGDFITILTVYDVPQNGHHEDATYGGPMDGEPTREAFTGEGSLVTTDVETTDQEDRPAQHSSSLAAAREGEVARESGLPPDLKRLYDAADDLDDDRLRRLLLQFERKRPQKYREMRQKTLAQLGREDPDSLRSVREVDLLSFKYALQHYSRDDRPLPAWLIRFPR